MIGRNSHAPRMNVSTRNSAVFFKNLALATRDLLKIA